MASLSIIKSGVLSSVQDMGRSGFAIYAIPASGVMDRRSATQANLIIGNPTSYPIIECTMTPPTLQFNDQCHISITGALSKWKINNEDVNMGQAIKISEGDILEGTPFQNGLRAYIAISGKIESSQYLNSQSYSTYLPYEMSQIKVFKNGDTIEWCSDNFTLDNIDVKFKEIPKQPIIKIRRGPEFQTLYKTSQVLLQEGLICTLGDQSNRMGSLLQGPKLICNPSYLVKSVGTIPGMIQLTSSGQMIIVLQDGQTTGGYPRIAYMTQSSLDIFNQIQIRKEVKLILE